jgi:HK97 gp10 family phage protein
MADAQLRGTSYGSFRITVRNQTALIANLKDFDDACDNAVRDVTRYWAEQIQELAIELAPYNKENIPPYHPGFLKDNIDLKYSEGGFAFEVGCWAEDFDLIGENLYAIFQEYGTSKHAAQPFLNPAYEWGGPLYRKDVTEVIRDLCRDRGGRGSG